MQIYVKMIQNKIRKHSSARILGLGPRYASASLFEVSQDWRTKHHCKGSLAHMGNEPKSRQYLTSDHNDNANITNNKLIWPGYLLSVKFYKQFLYSRPIFLGFPNTHDDVRAKLLLFQSSCCSSSVVKATY